MIYFSQNIKIIMIQFSMGYKMLYSLITAGSFYPMHVQLGVLSS